MPRMVGKNILVLWPLHPETWVTKSIYFCRYHQPKIVWIQYPPRQTASQRLRERSKAEKKLRAHPEILTERNLFLQERGEASKTLHALILSSDGCISGINTEFFGSNHLWTRCDMNWGHKIGKTVKLPTGVVIGSKLSEAEIRDFFFEAMMNTQFA